jgi:hypothetical protein
VVSGLSSGERRSGQASVEFVAVLPALAVCLLLAGQAVAAAWALWEAGNAARVGARAERVGADGEAAAREALPGALRQRARIHAGDGGRVRVPVPAPPSPRPRPSTRMALLRSTRGQASVELIGALPALVLAAALALQLLLVGYSLTIADGAAEAGALAGAAGADARRAAREALPGWARSRARVSADDGLVRVELRPPAPLAALADALEVSSEAWSRSPTGSR